MLLPDNVSLRQGGGFVLPETFRSGRECDRLLSKNLTRYLREVLKPESGAPNLSFNWAPMCVGLMVMTWEDFTRSRSDRRPFDEADALQTIELIEDYNGWERLTGTDGKGKFVEMAIDAQFLRIDTTCSPKQLVLADFLPLNKHIIPGYRILQAKAGSAKGKGKNRKSAAVLQWQLELEQKTPVVGGYTSDSEMVERALEFLHNIPRCLSLPDLDRSQVPNHWLEAAIRICESRHPEQITPTLQSLIKPEMTQRWQPKGVEAVLTQWATIEAEARLATTSKPPTSISSSIEAMGESNNPFI